MPPGGSKNVSPSTSTRSPNALATPVASTTWSPRRGPGGIIELHLVGTPLRRLGLGDQVVVGGDAGSALALAGAGRHPYPLELTLE